MNREIKYRGKSDGEWYYGSYVYLPDSDSHHIIPSGSYKPNVDAFTVDQVEVEPNTIGQFTGLHDKNGTDIYEGDVLLVEGVFGDYFGYVGFKYGAFCIFGIEPSEWSEEHSIDDVLALEDVDLRPFTSPICMTEMRSMKMNPCDSCAEILGDIHFTERFATLPERYNSLSEIARAMEEADMINFDFNQSLKNSNQ